MPVPPATTQAPPPRCKPPLPPTQAPTHAPMHDCSGCRRPAPHPHQRCIPVDQMMLQRPRDVQQDRRDQQLGAHPVQRRSHDRHVFRHRSERQPLPKRPQDRRIARERRVMHPPRHRNRQQRDIYHPMHHACQCRLGFPFGMQRHRLPLGKRPQDAHGGHKEHRHTQRLVNGKHLGLQRQRPGGVIGQAVRHYAQRNRGQDQQRSQPMQAAGHAAETVAGIGQGHRGLHC